VVHVINTLEVGGGAAHVLALARGLRRHGFESTAIAGGAGPAAAALRESGFAVEILPPFRATAPFAIAARLRRLAPDVVHLHGSRSGLLGGLAARLAGHPSVVYTAHMFSFRRRLPGPLPFLATRAERMSCALADRLICVSQSDRDAAVARGLAADRIAVVPNGIDLARFPARSDRRAELGFGAADVVVGMIGRLVEQKDPLAFVRMARRVVERERHVRFLVVGDGPLRGPLEAAGAALIESGVLRMVGFRTDVPELLATLDVVVLPSRWEAHPIGLIEAMAAERAVVASRLPNHIEVVDPGESGLLVALDDDAALVAAVLELAGDPARRVAESRYGIERMVERTAELYRALPARHSA
jgi:glycosyltransferase involved in cell wall biosynthesis